MQTSRMRVPRSRVAIGYLGEPAHVRAWNTELAWWGAAAALVFSGQRPIFKVYAEFENVADPEDPVTNPSVSGTNPLHGVEYYLDLAGDRDFLRLDLAASPLTFIEEGYEDYFTSPDGNALRIFAQTAGTEGYHEVPFSSAENSKLCGTALALARDPDDATQDIVLARVYLSSGDQLLKVSPTTQLGLTWEVPFTL